jgi:dTDP-4-dehydrorhamnose reductase
VSCYLIAGAGGMLGTALRQLLAERELHHVAPQEREFDITSESDVRAMLHAFGLLCDGYGMPGVLINAAAYTNVERAEDEPERAYLVNEHGPRLLAEAARAEGLEFIHVSTDFVFDGTKDGAYSETDAPNPLSVYGASKLAGERAVAEAYPEAMIVRTAWVYGPGGVNFPTKILELAEHMPALKVVTDEVGSPTYTLDLAAGILGLAEVNASGIYHLAGAGSCSRFELAERVLALAGLERTLEPVTSDAFPAKAARPRNSVLDCSKAGALGVTMPQWADGLERFMAAREA